MSLSTDQFIELLSGGRETRGVEFKAAGPRGAPLVFAFVARAVLAMSNFQLGGWVLLGIQDDSQMSGLVEDDLASWLEHDEVTASLNAYTDPFVLVDVERVCALRLAYRRAWRTTICGRSWSRILGSRLPA
jgi:hypothetical protein